MLKDYKKQVLKLIRHEQTKILAVAAGVGCVFGFLLGYGAGKRKMKRKIRREKVRALKKNQVKQELNEGDDDEL